MLYCQLDPVYSIQIFPITTAIDFYIHDQIVPVMTTEYINDTRIHGLWNLIECVIVIIHDPTSFKYKILVHSASQFVKFDLKKNKRYVMG